MSAEQSYLESLRGIRVAEVDQFRTKRDNGAFRDIPPIQALFEVAVIAAWTLHQAGTPVNAETLGYELRGQLTDLQVAELCASPYFQQALDARGIPGARTLDRPSAEQLVALQTMTDPSLGTPIMQRLKRLGISYKRWQGWLRQPVFAAALQDLQKKLDGDVAGMVKLAVHREALNGDVNAAKLSLELTGDYVPGGSTLQAAKSLDVVVQRLQEAIDIFTDDETRAKIAHYVRTGETPLGELEAVPYGSTTGQ